MPLAMLTVYAIELPKLLQRYRLPTSYGPRGPFWESPSRVEERMRRLESVQVLDTGTRTVQLPSTRLARALRRQRRADVTPLFAEEGADREIRMDFHYVAGREAGAEPVEPTKVGALFVAEGKAPEDLTVPDVVDAILAAIDSEDPHGPPNQRAAFHSMALRFDYHLVPFGMRAMFLDVGVSPTLKGATPQTYVLSSGQFRIEGRAMLLGEQPSFKEVLLALREDLVERRL